MKNILNIQNEFGAYLLNYIKSKVTNVEDAEDIFQEVIITIIEKSGQLEKSESLKSWLFTIARNRITDYYRTRKFGDAIDEVRVADEDEEKDAYQELQKCLSVFIEELPENYRDIIVQSEIQGRSQKEISESLGLNYVTLRSKVQRGRARIRDRILESCIIEKDAMGRVVECQPNPVSEGCRKEGSTCS